MLGFLFLLVCQSEAILQQIQSGRFWRPKILLLPGTNSRGWPGGPNDSPEINISSCPVKCDFVYSQDAFQTADAVVWDFCNIQAPWIPTEAGVVKPPSQKWVFSWEHESENCENCGAQLFSTVGSGIDWTMTYNSRSDFWLPYATMVRSHDPARARPAQVDHAAQKSNLLLWLVGNLKSNYRLEVFDELKQHLTKKNVHMLGRSGRDGKWPCDAGHGSDGKDVSECSRKHFSTYKFYFAAENHRCQDYITEKFFKGLQVGMVPVVLGGIGRKDYERVADGSSFIHIEDFKSVAELADRLKYLDEHDDEYNKYFEWRSTHEISLTSARNNAWCELCQNLKPGLGKMRLQAHGTGTFRKSKDLRSWWLQDTCK
eukprot:gnl/MRDRNA2_/MRDRNA2_102182_c0_seq1.p1 gnl/MRDRNA2_/MRDRNA2_102182_c0~~gnl/MRDRNA2_/MRDRNA2_102182_c0_seq1.p1  ORF type:complete len:371 (-),score=51.96 gnl/MRDRNA2_/MRDRNA2_102182_c0_seq1:109-1221(-)